jgi:hypothetical protein
MLKLANLRRAQSLCGAVVEDWSAPAAESLVLPVTDAASILQ